MTSTYDLGAVECAPHSKMSNIKIFERGIRDLYVLIQIYVSNFADQSFNFIIHDIVANVHRYLNINADFHTALALFCHFMNIFSLIFE